MTGQLVRYDAMRRDLAECSRIDPLVPPWVDLRKFDDMPLAVKRLRDSRFSAKVSPEEFRSGVLLWCAAWHQIPAASLPNDDAELAQLAGYGFAIKEWLRVKKGALHGWQEATDARLYNETAAEKALQSWAHLVDSAYRKFADRWRKENAKRKDRKEPPLVICTLNHWKEVTCSAGIPPESAIDSTGKFLQAIGNASTAQGIPPDFQTKERNGTEGSIYKSDVELTPTVVGPTDTAAPPKVKSAVENGERSKAKGNGGQHWDDETWVRATAKDLEPPVTVRPTETYLEFKDRVYMARMAATNAQA